MVCVVFLPLILAIVSRAAVRLSYFNGPYAGPLLGAFEGRNSGITILGELCDYGVEGFMDYLKFEINDPGDFIYDHVFPDVRLKVAGAATIPRSGCKWRE